MIKKSSYPWWVFSSRVKANHCKKDFLPDLYYYYYINNILSLFIKV